MRSLLSLCVIVSIVLLIPLSGPAQVHDSSFQQRFDLSQDPDALLKKILSAREFQEVPGQSLFDSIVEWLKQVVSKALAWIFGRLQPFESVEGGSGTLALVLAGVFIAGVAIFLVFMAVRLFSFVLAGRRGGSSNPPRAHPDVRSVSKSGDARSRALKAAEAGNYRSALVFLFHYALFWLAEQGRLSLHPGKTNREILESLDTGEPSRECLAEMVPLFNRVRYGKAPCGRDDYERFLALSHRVTERT
jgi:hypothetical protein